MHELAPSDDVHLLETILDEIFHSLDIVIGHLLYFLHLGCIFRCHIPVDVSECFEL